MVHYRLLLDDIVAEVSDTFGVVAPCEFMIEFIVELGQSGPTKIFVVSASSEVRRDGKGLRGFESIDARFLVWHRPKWLV